MTDDIFDLARLRRNFLAAEQASGRAREESEGKQVRPRSLRAEALALLGPLESAIRGRLGEEGQPALLLLGRVRVALDGGSPSEPLDPAALAEVQQQIVYIEDYLEAKLLIKKR